MLIFLCSRSKTSRTWASLECSLNASEGVLQGCQVLRASDHVNLISLLVWNSEDIVTL